jgi:hypothetical protein
LRNAEGSTRALKVGDEVRAGARIETGKDGWVKLAMADGSSVAVYEVSGVRFSAFAGPTADKQVSVGKAADRQLILDGGRVFCWVAKQEAGRSFSVTTPKAAVRVMGTAFEVRADEKKTRVETLAGLVRLTRNADGSTLDVPVGSYAEAGEGADMKLQPLPTARRNASYVDGPVVIRDDFSQGLGKWWIVLKKKDAQGIEPEEDGAQNSDQAADARYREKKVDVRVVQLPGESVKGFRIKNDESSPYGRVAVLMKQPLSGVGGVSFEADFRMDSDAGTVGGVAVVHKKAGAAKWETVEVGPTPEVRPGQWVHARTEATVFQDATGRKVVEVANFYDGKLRNRKRSVVEGDLGSPRLDAFVVGQGTLLVKDVVIRKMEPVGE